MFIFFDVHIHKREGPGDGTDCPGDGICRQLHIRSVGFPLTFSKTCKKCPFHYWLNNVIWAPTGPNRSRQRQSSTHMLQINQITEEEWGERKSERKRERKRDTARHLENWQYSLYLLPPPLLFLPPIPFTFLTLATPGVGSVLDLSQCWSHISTLSLQAVKKQKAPCFHALDSSAPDMPLENLATPQNGWGGK